MAMLQLMVMAEMGRGGARVAPFASPMRVFSACPVHVALDKGRLNQLIRSALNLPCPPNAGWRRLSRVDSLFDPTLLPDLTQKVGVIETNDEKV